MILNESCVSAKDIVRPQLMLWNFLYRLCGDLFLFSLFYRNKNAHHVAMFYWMYIQLG